jgi:hypothetical protein
MKIQLGVWYDSVDYEGNWLPSAVSPFKKESRSPFYICVNHLGGHVWIKTGEFRPLSGVNSAAITLRGMQERKRQMRLRAKA